MSHFKRSKLQSRQNFRSHQVIILIAPKRDRLHYTFSIIFRFFYYGTSSDERFDQLATKSFNRQNDNLYRGLFPLIPGKLSFKEGYDMGPLNFENESKEERNERLKNVFYGDTPRLDFPNEPERQEKVEAFYKVTEKHYSILDKAAYTMMQLIAEAGQADSHYFAKTFEPYANNTYRLIMYPHRNIEDIPKGAFLEDGRSKINNFPKKESCS